MELDEKKFEYVLQTQRTNGYWVLIPVLLAMAVVFTIFKLYGITTLCALFAIVLLTCIISDKRKSKIEQDILKTGRYAIGTVTDVKQEWRTNRHRYAESLVVLIKVDDRTIIFRVGSHKAVNVTIGDKVRVKLIYYSHVLAEGDVHNGNFVIYKEAAE